MSGLRLPFPAPWSARTSHAFLAFARRLSAEDRDGAPLRTLEPIDPSLDAAICVLDDLAAQGWEVSVDNSGGVAISPPEAASDPTVEKARIRRQELLKRDEQLTAPSVRKFVADMERPREFGGRMVSIFSLMRDGRELAECLREFPVNVETTGADLKSVIDPYIQIFGPRDRCLYTGLRLTDVWRYFRHTWTNQYTNTPGRTMMLLVRDRAAENHPVIGIAALASPIVQIAERDEWIGWQPSTFLKRLADAPTRTTASWIVRRLNRWLDELYIDDLIEDGLYWPSLWRSPSQESVERLREEARLRRRDHHRFVRRSRMTGGVTGEDWVLRARSNLFRSKRCAILADLLEARMALRPLLDTRPTALGLKRCLDEPSGRRAIAAVLRRAKADAIGTEIADLTVAGAIAPYNALLGGKLVSVLAMSPTVVRAYHRRYRDSASEIASSLAGRALRRRSHLVYVGTTSLYGSGSSQYNRLRVPAAILEGSGDMVFRPLGKSRSFGTSHLSNRSVAALVRLAEQTRGGVRVNSIFGEGVNPKLRKVRGGLDLLGWPSNELLQHRRPRIVYGVSLVHNLLPYLLEIDSHPRYMFSTSLRGDVALLADWWYERWALQRIRSPQVLALVAEHALTRPVHHGARVPLASMDTSQEVVATRS
jgi:hypothetical protein